MNKSQMENSIISVYGHNIDASTYLQKFINIECTLLKPTDKTKLKNGYRQDNNERYCNELYKKHGLDNFMSQTDKLELQSSMISIAKATNLTLRDLEKCYTYITLFYAGTNEKMLRLNELLAFLVIVKVKRDDVYNNLRNNNIDYPTLMNNVFVMNAYNKNQDKSLAEILHFLYAAQPEISSTPTTTRIRKILNDFGMYDNDRCDVIPYHCQLIDSFEFIS